MEHKEREREARKAAEMLLELVQSGQTVLDLGAGEASELAKRFQEKGAVVTAVERQPVDEPPEGIEWHEMTVEQFIEQGDGRTFDYVVLNNVLQYFDHNAALERIVPRLKALVKEGGRIAVETFTKHPEPPFKRSHASTFTAEELAAAFADWPDTRVWEWDGPTPDMKGNTRHFFLVDVLAKKPTLAE